MSCKNPYELRGNDRFIDVQFDYEMVKKMIEQYDEFKTETDYATEWENLYPSAIEIAGAASGGVFTPTVSEAWTPSDLVGKFAAIYEDGEKDIFSIQAITANDATTLTVAVDLALTVDTLVILDAEYKQLENRKDMNDEVSFDEIDRGSADTGNFKVIVNGEESRVTTASGDFYEKPAQWSLYLNQDESCKIYKIRTGDAIGTGKPYWMGYAYGKINVTGDNKSGKMYDAEFKWTNSKPTKVIQGATLPAYRAVE